ncbi:hypothetical protein JCM21900_005628 [Sporobolomyces salmonicolor]
MDRPPQQSNTDTCTYQIDFPPPSDSPSALTDLCAQILAFVSSSASTYIWHKQPFSLGLSPLSFTASASQQQHQWLQGKTDVTDAVDDEWFIVWLLRQVTNKWNDAVVAVEDDDGEFLLIEAAEVLPNWVTPQNAANRLWIYRGHLHLVPLEHKSALPFQDASMNPSFDPDEEGFIDRTTAIALVRDDEIDTLAPKEVEAAVWARIDGYPGKIKEHHHRTLAYLPTDVALALSDSPGLIAEAVGAFYEREPGTLKACNTMSRFPPAPPLSSASSSSSADSAPPESMTDSASSLPDTVFVPTLLTRPLYSQLVLQRFYPPKPFEKVGWMEAKLGKEDERRRSVGMKIACGFEMLYKLTSSQVRLSTSDDSLAFALSNPQYRASLKQLEEKGFFEGEVEGSEKWKEKERAAREGWAKAKTDRPTPSFAQRVDEAAARARSSPNPLPDRIPNPAALSPSAALALEDSEDFLSLDEQGLEDILASRGEGRGGLDDEGFSDDEEEDEEEGAREGMEGVDGGKGGEKGGNSRTQEEREGDRKARRIARRLEEMAGKVENFVEGRGAVEGALFEDERSDDDADSDEDVEMPTMSAEERASRMDTLVAPLPTSEWGQKAPSAPAAPPLADSAPAPRGPPRPSKLTAEKYDGASSDDSDTDDEAMPEGEEGLGGEEVEGEDGPSVVNEEEMMDMGEEMDEFLKFATETLGLSEEQYEGILGERRKRGAFVPGPAKEKKTNVIPSTSSPSSAKPSTRSTPQPPPIRQPLRNPNLVDFDTLMEQMEAELAQAKKGVKPSPAPAAASNSSRPSASPPSSSAKPRSSDRIVVDSLSDSDSAPEDDDASMEAMDAELSNMLKGMGGDGSGGAMDYNLVKNFLESFQSQGGFAGPAGNLSGRLGFRMPRDAEE